MNRKKCTGVTLIELLLGITIFSIIAVSLYATFSNGIKLNRKAESLEGLYQEANVLLNLMTKDLENMVPFNAFRSEGEETLSSFKGAGEQISFILPTDKGLKHIRYYLHEPDYEAIHKIEIGKRTRKNVAVTTKTVEGESLYFLVRDVGIFSDVLEKEKGPFNTLEILSEHVKEGSLKFSFTKDKNTSVEETAGWSSDWNEATFPTGVRVEFILASPDEEKEEISIVKDIYIPTSMWGQLSQ